MPTKFLFNRNSVELLLDSSVFGDCRRFVLEESTSFHTTNGVAALNWSRQ